jgi:uncharacterized protein (TIGR03118 family)
MLPIWAAVGCGGSGGSGNGGTASAGTFVETKLVADKPGIAAVTDPNLVNPWGVSFSPTGAFWLSDNGTGLSTLYNGAGAIQPLVVAIPAAGGGTNGPVSGQVFNSTTSFSLPGSTPAAFIFDSEDGLITAWNGGTTAVTVADRSATGAVYKGLAMGVVSAANELFATNFNSGSIDVFDSSFNYLKSFTDATVPAGFAPFGIQNIQGQLYVTFAKQDAAKHDDVAGPGNGFVDVFQTDGTFSKRLVSNGVLNSPWGMAVAPAGFGKLGGDLLVGNFGDGLVHAFSLATGASMGTLQTSANQPLVVSGLWALIFGNGGQGGAANTLYFTAGPNQESDGLFGSISPA